MNPIRTFAPSLLLGEAYPEAFRSPGAVADAARRLLAGGFFRRLEFPGTLPESEAERIGGAARAAGVPLTCWASRLIAQEPLNLSALDESARRHAVERLLAVGEAATRWGADTLGVLSGPDPGEASRAQAYTQLARSLVELALRLPLRIVIEPLDRAAHKRLLVGPVSEAVELIRATRARTPRVFLVWDSGHALLNGEDPAASLTLAAPLCAQIHLSNPVLDRADPRFGDHHYPVGDTGAGTLAQFSELLRLARTLPLPLGESTSVALEVRTQGKATPQDTLAHCEDSLRQILCA